MIIKFLEILKPYKVRYSFTLYGDIFTYSSKVKARNSSEAIDQVLDSFYIDVLSKLKTDTFKMLSVTVQEMR